MANNFLNPAYQKKMAPPLGAMQYGAPSTAAFGPPGGPARFAPGYGPPSQNILGEYSQRAASAQAGQYTAPYQRDPAISGMANFQAKNILDSRNFNHAYGQQLAQATQAGTPGMGLMTNEAASAMSNGMRMPNVTVGGAYGRGPSGNMADFLANRLGDTTDPGTLGALRSRQTAPWMHAAPGAVAPPMSTAGSQSAGIWSTRTAAKTPEARAARAQQTLARQDRFDARRQSQAPNFMDQLMQNGDPETALAMMQLQQNGMLGQQKNFLAQQGINQEGAFQQGQLKNQAAANLLADKRVGNEATASANEHTARMKGLEAQIAGITSQAQRDVAQFGAVQQSTQLQHQQTMAQLNKQHEERMAQFDLSRRDDAAKQSNDRLAVQVAAMPEIRAAHPTWGEDQVRAEAKRQYPDVGSQGNVMSGMPGVPGPAATQGAPQPAGGKNILGDIPGSPESASILGTPIEKIRQFKDKPQDLVTAWQSAGYSDEQIREALKKAFPDDLISGTRTVRKPGGAGFFDPLWGGEYNWIERGAGSMFPHQGPRPGTKH